jgi:hypothetical protein
MSKRNSKLHKQARRIARSIQDRNARRNAPITGETIWVEVEDKYGRKDFIKQVIPTRRF